MRRSDFFEAVMDKVGGITTPHRIAIGVTWASYEDTNAENNPFATTEPWEGATEFNSVGVKNYLTAQDGINATAATLENGYYNKLLHALRNPTASIRTVIGCISSSPWGSHPSTTLYDSVEKFWGHYNVEVPGSGSTTDVLGLGMEKTMTDEVGSNETATETPSEEVVDTLESRLAALEIADRANATPVAPTVEEPTTPLA